MTEFTQRTISGLITKFTTAPSLDRLWLALTEFCTAYDLKHARVSIYDVDARIKPANFKHVRTWPEGPGSWGQYYLDHRLYEHDRSFQLIFDKRTEWLFWTAMDEHTRKGSAANRVFKDMREFGIGEGVLVGHSSTIMRHTILLGLAGPSASFRLFTRKHKRPFVKALQTFVNCYLELALREGRVVEALEPPIAIFTDRQREVLHLLSIDKTIEEVAGKLQISRSGVKSILDTCREKTGIRERTALCAFALRSKQIQ